MDKYGVETFPAQSTGLRLIPPVIAAKIMHEQKGAGIILTGNCQTNEEGNHRQLQEPSAESHHKWTAAYRAIAANARVLKVAVVELTET